MFYDLELERISGYIRDHKNKRVGVQLPPGLKKCWIKIRDTIEEAGAEGLLVGTSCYGACDVADQLAKQAGCDLLLHFGHSEMGLKTCLPVLYIEAKMKVDPWPEVSKVLPHLRSKRVGLTASVQHVHFLPRIMENLVSLGFQARLGRPGKRAKYKGQVLGCDVGSAVSLADQVDEYLYIGTGEFHPLGVAAATGKRVIAVNPLGGFKEITAERFLLWRKGVIAKACSGEKFGILLSIKPGQWDPKRSQEVAELLTRHGRKVSFLIMDEIKVEELRDYNLDAYVCTACPRLALDDAKRTDVPILTPFEAKVMLGVAELKTHPLQ